MSLYVVTRKSDGAEVYRYVAAQVVADSYPLALFNHTDTPENAPPPVPSEIRITKLSFRSRFTQTEKIAIEIAALDDPTASLQVRAMSAALRANQEDVSVAQYIDLNRADTREGVQALEVAGLIGTGRATVILDTAPTADEAWNG